jgi:hypothetical protein
MSNTKEVQELKAAHEQLEDQYQEALDIIDVKGDEYIEEYLDEDDSIRFKELVDMIFNYYDVLETVDKDDIDDWNSQLEDYLAEFWNNI